MIQLTIKNITNISVNHLAAIQQIITNELTFERQVKRANSRWNGKSRAAAGRTAFENIKHILIEMCVGNGICVYCEQNEASDIEHIFPKRSFPDRAFSWDNYVLICKHCNTTYKSDKFEVFNPINSAISFDIKTPYNIYQQPPTNDALFINQRVENPMNFFELDLLSGQFIYLPIHPFGTREYLRAKYTIDLLQLNIRAPLVAARKSAAKHYKDRLTEYVAVLNSTNFAELKTAVDDDIHAIDETLNFNIEKDRIKESVKNYVKTYQHPSVWKEYIKQRALIPNINALFNAAPEALTWI